MLKLCVFSLCFALAYCYTVPAPVVSNTDRVQRDARDAAKDLGKVPANPRNSIQPQDITAIYRAQSQLDTCSSTLRSETERGNKCAGDLQELGDHYRKLEAEKKALDDEYSWTNRIAHNWHMFLGSAIFGAVMALFGPQIISFVWSLIKVALKIP